MSCRSGFPGRFEESADSLDTLILDAPLLSVTDRPPALREVREAYCKSVGVVTWNLPLQRGENRAHLGRLIERAELLEEGQRALQELTGGGAIARSEL